LSWWLGEWDDSLRMPDHRTEQDEAYGKAISQALDGIGARALPVLLRWAKGNGWGIALTGFRYYGTNALPLLPELDKQMHSPVAETRKWAYGFAFFSRPPKGLFIPIAGRALMETDTNVQTMAVTWMALRFPDEAVKRGLKSIYLPSYEKATAANQVK